MHGVSADQKLEYLTENQVRDTKVLQVMYKETKENQGLWQF